MANKKWIWASHMYSQWTASKSDNRETAQVRVLKRTKRKGAI